MYKAELEKLQSLGFYIDGELKRLRDTLLERIPYARESLTLLDIEERLSKKIGSGVDSEELRQLSVEFLAHTISLDNDISRKETEILKLEQELETQQLQVADLKRSQRKLRRLRNQLQNLKRLRHKYLKVPKNVGARKAIDILESGDLLRLKRIPNKSEFIAGLYYSLCADKLYTSPTNIDTAPVTREWIERQMIPLFTHLLSEYFTLDTRDGSGRKIHLPGIRDLSESIDTLPDRYSEDIDIESLPRYSQVDIERFISTLIGIVPEYHLLSFPDFRPTERVRVPKAKKIPKKHRDIRVEKANTKQEKEQKRKGLIDGIESKEEKLGQYLQYRLQEKKNIKKRLLFLEDDLSRLRQNLPRARGQNNTTEVELLGKIGDVQEELKVVNNLIATGKLIDNKGEYEDLIRQRAELSNQLRNMR